MVCQGCSVLALNTTVFAQVPKQNLSDRQVRWWEFLSHFNYTIRHIDGIDNKVADCLSHYYENDTSEDNHSENTYVNVDIRLVTNSHCHQRTHHQQMMSLPLQLAMMVNLYKPM